MLSSTRPGESRFHNFRSDGFFWAADSKTVVFADDVQGRLSVVLAAIGDIDHVQVVVHPVSLADLCEGREGYVTLSGINLIDLPDGTHDVQASFRSSDPGCVPRAVIYFWTDFRAPEPEVLPDVGKKRPRRKPEKL